MFASVPVQPSFTPGPRHAQVPIRRMRHRLGEILRHLLPGALPQGT